MAQPRRLRSRLRLHQLLESPSPQAENASWSSTTPTLSLPPTPKLLAEAAAARAACQRRRPTCLSMALHPPRFHSRSRPMPPPSGSAREVASVTATVKVAWSQRPCRRRKRCRRHRLRLHRLRRRTSCRRGSNRDGCRISGSSSTAMDWSTPYPKTAVVPPSAMRSQTFAPPSFAALPALPRHRRRLRLRLLHPLRRLRRGRPSRRTRRPPCRPLRRACRRRRGHLPRRACHHPRLRLHRTA